jgi:hypothetical protein
MDFLNSYLEKFKEEHEVISQKVIMENVFVSSMVKEDGYKYEVVMSCLERKLPSTDYAPNIVTCWFNGFGLFEKLHRLNKSAKYEIVLNDNNEYITQNEKFFLNGLEYEKNEFFKNNENRRFIISKRKKYF